MILSSRTHYAIALTFLQDAAEANLTLEEKRLLQRRAARFAELSRRAAVLEAEEGKPEEAPMRPINKLRPPSAGPRRLEAAGHQGTYWSERLIP